MSLELLHSPIRKLLTRHPPSDNYILSSALTSAISIFGIIWFFASLYKNFEPVWWGNNISYEGCDAAGCPYLAIPDKGCFGPAPACPN